MPGHAQTACCQVADGIAAGRSWYRLLTAGLLASLAFCTMWAAPFTHPPVVSEGRLVVPTTPKAPDRTLVMYIFADTDPEFLNNLHYFVREAIRPDDNCDYVIVLQQTKDAADARLPVLPKNAKFVHHKNECYDWGTFGWLLTSGHVNVSPYRYFIFMNCSVRGPYFPAYLQGKLHWTVPLLSKITDVVKLVGPTISCEGSPFKGDPDKPWRRNPHVQSFVAATDRVGLRVLLEQGKVFQCHHDRWDAIFFSELGSSAAILSAGYNLDCLMLRYQGVDWRNQSNWECNARSSPANMAMQYDGISLDPLEVMFVKVKSYLLDAHAPFAVQAVKFEKWQELASEAKREDITSNMYVQMRPKIQAEQALLNEARGSGCFDIVFYREHNPDLAPLSGPEDLWQHFLRHGQFEGRTHRFFCDVNYDQLADILKKEANVTSF